MQTLEKNSTQKILHFLLDWAAVIALVLCFIVFTALKGEKFMSMANMINILLAMSITTVFGIAATVTMAPDGFDMSACTLGSCSAYVFVSMYLWYGLSLGMSIVMCIVVTLIMYQLTMFLILVCKIPDMLATCALMFVHQGLGQWYIGGGAVSTGMRVPHSGADPARTTLSNAFSAIGRSPYIIIIMLACVLVAFIFLNYTKHGRFLYAMGGNKQAAKLSGINVKKYRYLAGMITAVFIAIGGIMVAARGNSAQVGCCDNYLMQALAAVFVGRSVGGAEKPNALGTLVGAMLVSTLENGLTICAVPYYILPAVKGAVLALASIALVAATLLLSRTEGQLTLYDGDYSEVKLMHAMVELLVEDKTDLEVVILDQMTQVNNHNELKGSSPSCDLMFSYDGTVLTTFLGLDTSDIPAGETLYDFVNETVQEREGLRLLGKVGLNNTYSIGVTQEVIDRYAVSRISDLVPLAGELDFGAEHEFYTEEGSMKYRPFADRYGLQFRSAKPVDVVLKYSAVESGAFDVMVVYATDGLNKRAGLTILEDDLGFFPEYYGAFLVREDLFQDFYDAAPNLEQVLELLTGQVSSEDMVELTYAVDVDGRAVAEVAREFLVSKGLLTA